MGSVRASPDNADFRMKGQIVCADFRTSRIYFSASVPENAVFSIPGPHPASALSVSGPRPDT
jgi:hypothetical protein